MSDFIETEPPSRSTIKHKSDIMKILARAKSERKYHMSNKIYNFLKYTALIALPALNVFWLAISAIWGLILQNEISLTISAVNALLGGLLGISSYNYNKEKK